MYDIVCMYLAISIAQLRINETLARIYIIIGIGVITRITGNNKTLTRIYSHIKANAKQISNFA